MPKVHRIARKTAPDNGWVWVSFKFEELKGPAVDKNAVDR